jgi:uncharacterized protein (DUF934 family)
VKGLIKNGRLSDDVYATIGPDDAIAPTGDVIVPLVRWQVERSALAARRGRLGIRLKSDEPPALIADDLGLFSIVALEFPAFRDGRAYSYARLLRDQYRFGGEIRAVGDVLLEQLHFMVRVGFDAFELVSDDPQRDFDVAAGDFSVWYQPASDERRSALELRHRGS